jgi:hypothetical protein
MRKREADVDTLVGLRSSSWRAPDWTAAAVAGFAAGAVLMVLDLIWSTLYGQGPWRTSHMIAPIFLGTDSPAASGYAFSVGVVYIALAVHYALGILFGLAMGAVMAQFRLDATVQLALAAGAILGLALYLLNFEGLVAFFPWLAELRGGDTLAAHVVFGIVAALLYRRLKRTPGEA